MATTLYEKILQYIKENMSATKFEKIQKQVKKVILLNDIRLPSTLYQLFIINCNKNRGLTQKQILSIENKMRNALKNLPHTKAFIVVSTTDSANAQRITIKTNGRYRTEVRGTKVPTHVHIGAIGNEFKSARTLIHLVHERLKKVGIQSRIGSKKNSYHAINYINYCYRQAVDCKNSVWW